MSRSGRLTQNRARADLKAQASFTKVSWEQLFLSLNRVTHRLAPRRSTGSREEGGRLCGGVLQSRSLCEMAALNATGVIAVGEGAPYLA